MKLSKIQTDIKMHARDILGGKMLCIDPSTGSGSSLPGYAVYHAGVLKESGVVQVDISASRNKRLFEIRRTLQEEFEIPDVLVLEHISSIAFGALKYNANAFVGLHRGVGAIMSAFNVDAVIEVPPRVWKSTIDADYTKGDESDAVYIGKYVIEQAVKLTQEELPNVKKVSQRRSRIKKKAVRKTGKTKSISHKKARRKSKRA